MEEAFSDRVGIVGTGNVAWHLVRLLRAAQIPVAGVLTRNAAAARQRKVGLRFEVPLEDNLTALAGRSDIIIIAVNDAAITNVASNLTGFSGLVCHTSGSSTLSVLSPHCTRTGVLYPLQTLTAGEPVAPEEMPLCIEGSDHQVVESLVRLAKALGCPAQVISSEERIVLHVAAVFACNFTNHMMAIAHSLLTSHHADPSLLAPLIRETARKALLSEDPGSVQTGPAIRGDEATMKRHLGILSERPDWKNIYAMVSKSIETFKNQ